MLENDHDEIMQILSDTAVNPNPQDVSRLFAEWRSHNLGPENGNEMFEKLDVLIQDIWKMEGKFPFKNTQQICMIQAAKQMMNKNHLIRKESNVTFK